jgi:Putative MetA-pathway of phenol degradation
MRTRPVIIHSFSINKTQRRTLFSLTLSALLFITTAVATRAQQFMPPVTDYLPSTAGQSATSFEEEEFIKPGRPGVANPAEFQKPGVLQLEFGYDANFRARDFRTEQTLPLALRFAAASRLLLELNFDTLKSETDEQGTRMTGIGDTRIGFQVVALKDTAAHPALAFAYYAKLPSASTEKGLGTGRVDHKIVLLLSRKIGKTDLDFNGAYLIVGREGESGWVTGGQAALAVSREFENNFGLQAELSGQSKEDVQPIGLYALGALTYKANRRLIFDAGMRFGLNRDAPRVGVFAGMTVGIADLYRRKH